MLSPVTVRAVRTDLERSQFGALQLGPILKFSWDIVLTLVGRAHRRVFESKKHRERKGGSWGGGVAEKADFFG